MVTNEGDIGADDVAIIDQAQLQAALSMDTAQVESGTNAEDPSSKLFSRESYAKADFWNDRFSENDAQFDWYANWRQIKPVFQAEYPLETFGNARYLMVGCGNSKLSEEMARDGYPLIDNMDVSSVVLQKMFNLYSPIHTGFEFTAMDATKMNYRDNSFDVCVDKGTYDALACGPDRSVIRNLTQEMLRVASHSVVIVSSGTPDRRMVQFEEFLEGRYESIEHKELEISQLAQLINILRTDLKNKPLSHAVREDPAVLMRALKELQCVQLEKRLKKEAKNDPKKKLMYFMYKAKNMKMRQIAEQERAEKERVEALAAKLAALACGESPDTAEEAKEEAKGEAEEEASYDGDEKKILYNPRRQDFVMVYIIHKKRT